MFVVLIKLFELHNRQVIVMQELSVRFGITCQS
jgi:hypothetical protein